jgi:energy-coupling factor transport system permease protein
LTVACGASAAGVVVAASLAAWPGIVPSQRAELPSVPLLTVLAVVVAAVPAVATPRPVRSVREVAP